MLQRLTLIGYLASVALGSVFGFVGILQGEPWVFAAASTLVGMGFLMRFSLRASAGEVGAEVEVGEDFSSGRTTEDNDTESADELVVLLRTWQALEKTRGTRAFDPWEAQSLRREIGLTVKGSEALQRLLGPEHGG